MELEALLAFRSNVLSLAIIEDLAKNEVLIEVENIGVPTQHMKVYDLQHVITFFNHVMVYSHHVIRKLIVNAAIPLCGNLIGCMPNIQQLFIKLTNRSKLEDRKTELNLDYPIDICSYKIKQIPELKTMRTLALFTPATFTIEELLENRVCRLEILQNTLKPTHLNTFVQQWAEGNVESEDFHALTIILHKNIDEDVLFEDVEYENINNVEERLEDVVSKYLNRRHISYFKVFAVNRINYMKIKIAEKRIDFEMF